MLAVLSRVDPEYDWSTFNMEEIREWYLTEAPGGHPEAWPYWEMALTHRYAWTCRRMKESEGSKELITKFCNLTRGGSCAWVSPAGKIFPVEFATHDRMADIIIGMDSSDLEKSFARVSHQTESYEECWRHVERPTKKMKDAVIGFINDHIGCYYNLKNKFGVRVNA